MLAEGRRHETGSQLCFRFFFRTVNSFFVLRQYTTTWKLLGTCLFYTRQTDTLYVVLYTRTMKKVSWLIFYCRGKALPYAYACRTFFGQFLSWCFEPSQPQRIISWLKTNFNLSPSLWYLKPPMFVLSRGLHGQGAHICIFQILVEDLENHTTSLCSAI